MVRNGISLTTCNLVDRHVSLYAHLQSWLTVNSVCAQRATLLNRATVCCSVTKGLTKRARRQGVSRRGLHATALEVGKLALGLDPGDPLGLLLYVDYLALRAQQWDFLEVRHRFWTSGLGKSPKKALKRWAWTRATPWACCSTRTTWRCARSSGTSWRCGTGSGL